MKRLISFILFLAIFIHCVPLSVYAQRDFSNELVFAQELKELGLFRGVSDTDFDLESAPTREQAVTMLIRLLGKENEALNGTWEHPFADVSAWADPYIGYAYENGLTLGVSDTEFGTGNASAAMYLTFVLRALGYSDTTALDFTWDNPYALSETVGILSDSVDLQSFLRADVVTVSYAALQAFLKGTAQTLMEKLISSSDDTNEPILPEVDDLQDAEVMVPILMFHDVKTYAGGTWSMSADNFRKTLGFLSNMGYTPISFEQLVRYVDGQEDLPPKPVCITLDDGYFSNYRNVLPIVTELNVPITVFVTCGTIRAEGSTPSANESILEKMSAAELRVMESSPLVSIQSHTYALHGINTTYSDTERTSALPLDNESESVFKDIFAKDCMLAENLLFEVGVKENVVFSYPNGKYHTWTEQVLKDRGYRVSITTNSGHINRVVKGDSESLFLLGRLNVNDDTTEEGLLRYLEKTP